jgi:hypothetical protein
MTWTCEQIEARLSDYIEGLLEGPERAEFEAHAASCAECAPLLASVRELVGGLHAMEEVEVPPQLVHMILDKTLGPRETVSFWQTLRNFLRGMGSPKFAYGVASVFATCFVLVYASGFSFRKPKLADLHPATVYQGVDRGFHMGRAKVVKYVSDLRVVYEIQSRLREEQNNLQVTPQESLPKSNPEKEPGQTDDQKPAQPRQQNRANELARQMEMVAAECPLLLERSFR